MSDKKDTKKRKVFDLGAPAPEDYAKQMRPKAEASMFAYDFSRYNQILISCAEYGILARSGNPAYLKPYLEAMWQFWIEIWEMIDRYDKNMNKEIDSEIGAIRINLDDFFAALEAARTHNLVIQVPQELISRMGELHRKLLEIKQKLNLGVWLKTPLSEAQRMARGI